MIRLVLFLVVAWATTTIVVANDSDNNRYAELPGSNMVDSPMEVTSRNMAETLHELNSILITPYRIDEQPELKDLLMSSLKSIMELMQFDSESIELERFASHMDGMRNDELVLQWLNPFLTFLHSDRGRSLPTDVRCELFVFTTAFISPHSYLPLSIIGDTTSLQLFIETTVTFPALNGVLEPYLTNMIPQLHLDLIAKTIECMYSSKNSPVHQICFLLDRVASHTLIALYTWTSSLPSSSSNGEFELAITVLQLLITKSPLDLAGAIDRSQIDLVVLSDNLNRSVTSSIEMFDNFDNSDNNHSTEIMIMKEAPYLVHKLSKRLLELYPTWDELSHTFEAMAKNLFDLYRRLSKKLSGKFDRSLFVNMFIELLKDFKFDFAKFEFADLSFNTTLLTDMWYMLHGCALPSLHQDQIPASDEHLQYIIDGLLSVEFDPKLLMENLGHICHYMSPALEPYPAL